MAIHSRALGLALLVIGLSVLAPAGARAQFADAAAPDATAADDGTGQSSLLNAEQLNALVAPVALYPDDLLAIVLPACTNPIQVVEAGKFLEKQKADPSLKPDESWDPSVIALVNYPEVVTKLNEDIGWTQDLGNAVLDQQQDVLNAIQAARESASQGGYLQSNDHVTVVNEGDNISIESPNPDVIYVPQYDPQPIVYNNYTTSYPPPYYSDPYPPYWYPTATFFAGAFVGAAFAYGFDWDNGDIDIDNDINISRGDTNIGSGNNVANIDKSKLQNKFNGERKAGSDKMKWSNQKARQKSSATRKPTATQRPTSGSIQQGLGQGGAGQFKGQGNNLKNNKAAKNQANRGNQSLQQKNKQQLRQNNANKQNMQRQQQQRQQPTSRQQVRQKPNNGGAWAGQGNQRVKQNSARGNKSMNRSGGGGGRPPKVSRSGGGRR